METWTKRSYVCDPDNCDALYEITVNDKYPATVDNFICHCGRTMQLVSEQDATIYPFTMDKSKMIFPTTTKEETMITSDKMEPMSWEQAHELRSKLDMEIQNSSYWKAEVTRTKNQIIDLINHAYDNELDSDDILTNLCEIIDYSANKEIEFTATIEFTGRIDVPRSELSSFDLAEALEEAYVDINNGNIVIDEYNVTEVDEA